MFVTNITVVGVVGTVFVDVITVTVDGVTVVKVKDMGVVFGPGITVDATGIDVTRVTDVETVLLVSNLKDSVVRETLI